MSTAETKNDPNQTKSSSLLFNDESELGNNHQTVYSDRGKTHNVSDANPRASTSRYASGDTEKARKASEKSERGRKLAEKAKAVRELKIKHGLSVRPRSKSNKAGLLLPVDRVLRSFRKSFPHRRVNESAGVYLTAVLEYMCSEVLDLAGECALARGGHKRITPRDVQLAISNDSELAKLLSDVVIAQGGVVPYIHAQLLQKPKPKSAKRPVTSTPEQERIAKKRKSSDKVTTRQAATQEEEKEGKEGEQNEEADEVEEREVSKKQRVDPLQNLSREDCRAVLKYFRNVNRITPPGSGDLDEEEEDIGRNDEAPAAAAETTEPEDENTIVESEEEKTEANTTNVDDEEPQQREDNQKAEEEAAAAAQEEAIRKLDSNTQYTLISIDEATSQEHSSEQLLDNADYINPSQMTRNNQINVAAESQVIVLEDFDFLRPCLIPEMIDTMRQDRRSRVEQQSFVDNNLADSLASTDESVLVTSSERRVLGERSMNVEAFQDVQIAMRVTSPKQQQKQRTNRNQTEQ